jgi:hypothetical protein
MLANLDKPRTYKEALNDPIYGSQWERPTKDEMASIMKNGTWTLVPRPMDRKVVLCKWVFKPKIDENGTIQRIKARLVARGFTQLDSDP